MPRRPQRHRPVTGTGSTASQGRAGGLLAFGHPERWPQGFPAAATEIPPHQPAPRAGEGLGDSGLRSCLRPAPPRPPAPRHTQSPRGDHRSTLRHATGRYTGPSLIPQPIPRTRPHLDRPDRAAGEHDPARAPDRTRCDQKAGTPRLRPAGHHRPQRVGRGGEMRRLNPCLRTCLRRGRSDSGMDGAPFASAGP